ncbi:MAG TPA: hypothetical protein VG457_17345, partial [Planctomycetota bacterium]|nr:hypothetical protein [Planctomycetota bacterium]
MTRYAGCLLSAVVLSGMGCEAVQQIAEAAGKTKVSMTMKNGQKVEGTLLKDENGQSVVQVKYGSVTVSSGEVASVETTGTAPVPPAGEGRLARWDHCLHVVSERSWSHHLVQVPATVIDLGILRNVPYFSHRSGDFELNVYGDPDHPACLEIGLYNGAVNPAERSACQETMLALLTDPADRQTLRTMNLQQSRAVRAGMVFEVTPPTEKDSYGGWWISVYDEPLLDRQRASAAELANITVPRAPMPPHNSPTAVGVHPPAPAPSLFHWKDQEV